MCYLSTFLTYCNDFSITIINKGNLKTVMTKKLIYFFKLIVFDGKPVFFIKNVGSSVIHFARKMVDGLWLALRVNVLNVLICLIFLQRRRVRTVERRH